MTVSQSIFAGRFWPRPGIDPLQHNVEISLDAATISAIAPAAAQTCGGLVMPAIVNAHDHGYGLRPMAFGCVDDSLEPWIAGLRARPRVDPYLEAAVAFGRMASTGIGTTVHCHNSHNADTLIEEAADVARAAKDVGIRVAFSCPIADRNPWVYGGIDAIRDRYSAAEWDVVKDWQPKYAPAAEQLARVDAIAAAHQTDSFNVQYGPVGPQWCHDETLAMIADTSARTGRRVHMHLLETKRQREWTDQTYAGGVVRYLDQIGLLSPRLTVAHGVWLTLDECALLAQRGVTVAVNTTSNLRLRSGLAPVKTFFEKGTRFAIGLDGTALDDDQDALRDLRLTHLLHGGTDLTPDIPVEAFLAASIINGGIVFNGDAEGRALRAGGPADLICLDYDAMAHDIVADSADETDVFMTRASARFLRTLIVAGRPLVSDGRLVSVDLPTLEKELHEQANRSANVLRRERGNLKMHREHVRAFYRDRGTKEEAQ